MRAFILALFVCFASSIAAPLPYDGVVRPQKDGSSVAYMDPPNIANHASSIEQLSDGTLLLAWFSGIKEEANKCAIAVSRLPVGSSQWSKPVIVSERDGFSNQNPVLFHDASTKTTFLYHSQLAAGAGEGLDNLWILQSTDGGVSWSKPSVFLDKSKDGKGIFDRNRIIPRTDGSLLFPLYWTTDGTPNTPFMLISSASNHSTWENPVDVKNASNLVQPTVVRTSSGTLKAFFRDRKSTNVFGASSTDEGLTWTTPTPASAGNLPNNNAGIEAFQLASGNTILLFNNCTQGRTPMTAALSSSGGIHWDAHRNLQVHDDNSSNTKGVEYSYPTVLQTPDGTIHAAYTYNRQTIKYVAFTEGWVRGQPAQPQGPPPPTAVVTITIPSTAPVSKPIPPNYVSLSMEIDDALAYLGPATNTSVAWVALMRLLGSQSGGGGTGPTLRIGGDSADYSLYYEGPPPPKSDLPRGQKYAITRWDLEAYRSSVPQWNGALVLDTTLFFPGNTTFAEAHVRGISAHLGWELVDAVEVGNEPEGFNGGEALRPRNWGPLDYAEEFQAHVLAMRGAGMPGGALMQGAVFGGNDTAFDRSFANYTRTFGARGMLRSVSRHHYSLSSCGPPDPPPTKAALLASVPATVAFLAPYAAAAADAGVEFRVGEFNSAACGGAKGTSDTFAAALWALDSLLGLASLNASQVNLHGGPHNAYSPVQTLVPSTDPIVMPAYYGMWAAAAATANGSVLLNHTLSGGGAGTGLLLGVHALAETRGSGGGGGGGGGVLRCVVVHKDPQGSTTQVSVVPPPLDGGGVRQWEPTATLVRLVAGGGEGVGEQFNISFAGLSFQGTRDGVPVAGEGGKEVVPLVHGAYSFEVAKGSAAILSFSWV